MRFHVSCQCGAEIEISAGQAGASVTCDCGIEVETPTLSELKRQAAEHDAAKRAEVEQDADPDGGSESRTDDTDAEAKKRQPLSKKKKLVFSLVVLLVAAGPVYLLTEIAYRIKHGIPVVGGVVYRDDMRLDPELLEAAPEIGSLLNRFQRSDNPVLFYEPRPGYADETYKINSAGFRDREFALEKSDDVFRIVVLGDSIIWGHGLPQDKTFAKQLESKLNQQSRDGINFEALNFGVSGYSTVEEVELFRTKAIKYDPDLVIVGYCLNDYFDSSLEAIAFHQTHYGLFSKSYVWDHVRRTSASWSYEKFGVDISDDKANKRLRQKFTELTELAPCPVAMLIFPTLHSFDDYGFRNEHARAASAAGGLGIEIIDLLDAYKEYRAVDLKVSLTDHTHPNAKGTGIAADVAIKRLANRSMLPKVASAASEHN